MYDGLKIISMCIKWQINDKLLFIQGAQDNPASWEYDRVCNGDEGHEQDNVH